MTKYNSWPIGRLPADFQRTELDDVKRLGYEWDDPRDIVNTFEKKVARFAGSKYAVAVDCCTNGIFLCLKYINSNVEVTIPSRTYASVPMAIRQAGYKVKFVDKKWSGFYQLEPLPIVDSAVRWTQGMYLGDNQLQVISFQIKKRIPIGKGGVILTDSAEAYEWLKLARYDGRDMQVPYDDPNHFKMAGYHMYMTPEDAARGIILMDKVPNVNEDVCNQDSYPDLTKYNFNFMEGEL